MYNTLRIVGILMVAWLVFAGMWACSGKGGSEANKVYKDITQLLNQAWNEMGSPAVTRENMEEVKDLAWNEAIKKTSEWPAGTGFALSVMPDHIFISIDADGQKKEGEWKP